MAKSIKDFKELIANPYYGLAQGPLEWEEIDWLRELGNDVYFALLLRLPGQNNIQLPPGHRLYVVSFIEPFDVEWLTGQLKQIDAPIIVLTDGEFYDYPFPKNVHAYTYHSWHKQIGTLMEWWPNRQSRQITHKVSALCNRITQSKLVVFTALIEYLGEKDCIVKLSEWLEEKNVHYREPTGNKVIDELAVIFYNKYLGRTYKVDEFNNDTENYQGMNSNPWNTFYLNSALHFTNASYHYSLMINGTESYIRPGPHLDEKTFKCLVAGTPFIPVGQFRTYGTLRNLGLEFNYGLDLSWDEDPRNITRLVGIVNLIKNLTNYTKEDLVEMTRNSTEHNTDMIWSGEFQRRAQEQNALVREQILKEFA
jgi:hypothetical protein